MADYRLSNAAKEDLIRIHHLSFMELDIDKYLTITLYDPSPHRFDNLDVSVGERTLPIVYSCNKCNNKVSFKTSDFEKHNNIRQSNLDAETLSSFEEELKQIKFEEYSFIDFYCPKCKQATIILYKGGPSGYWGYYEFKIDKLLVLNK